MSRLLTKLRRLKAFPLRFKANLMLARTDGSSKNYLLIVDIGRSADYVSKGSGDSGLLNFLDGDGFFIASDIRRVFFTLR